MSVQSGPFSYLRLESDGILVPVDIADEWFIRNIGKDKEMGEGKMFGLDDEDMRCFHA